MEAYQEEYIANTRAFQALNMKRLPEDGDLASYRARLERLEQDRGALLRRNMELLRGCYLPVQDHLPDAPQDVLDGLEEFAQALYSAAGGLDVALFCQIHRALLGLARQKNDRAGIIRELYWMGIGRHGVYNKVAALDDGLSDPYMVKMRLCFVEAAAYLKYFEEFDGETQGYIMRSLANSALGRFSTTGERTGLLRRAIRTFQDPYYRGLAPHLPWDRYVLQCHRLMISSLPHGSNRTLTARDVSAMMESSHIVYHGGEAPHQPDRVPPSRQVFHLAAIDRFCGVIDMDRFLAVLEEQMEGMRPNDFSPENTYRTISLPAFYCLYLGSNPERVPPRERYLARLYRRIVAFVDAFPAGQEDETVFLYLRQLSATYLEVDGGIPYGAFLSQMLRRFAPDIYLHANQVAAAARALCAAVLDEEPDFFDDIEFVRAAPPEEKRELLLDFAVGCGQFHDVGKINFLDLYTRTARQWTEDEYEISRLHMEAGYQMLSGRPSTQPYAAAALGHHMWYDGSRGYPGSYKRLERDERQVVDVVALVDYLAQSVDALQLRRSKAQSFEQAVESAAALGGRRFSPLLTARLRDAELVKQLKQALEEGRQEVYRELYQR